MNTPKLTEVEQRELRDVAKNVLLQLEKHFSDINVIKVIENFKNKFNICETVYKTILLRHQNLKGKSVTMENLKLDMTQAPHALTFAGYNFNHDLLNELFGSKSSKGQTVKKLRDATTHGISEKAVQEILTRQKELFLYMDEFLNAIRNFDAPTAA